MSAHSLPQQPESGEYGQRTRTTLSPNCSIHFATDSRAENAPRTPVMAENPGKRNLLGGKGLTRSIVTRITAARCKVRGSG